MRKGKRSSRSLCSFDALNYSEYISENSETVKKVEVPPEKIIQLYESVLFCLFLPIKEDFDAISVNLQSLLHFFQFTIFISFVYFFPFIYYYYCYLIFSFFYQVEYIQYTIEYIQNIIFYRIYTVYHILWKIYSLVYTIEYILCKIYYTKYTMKYILFTVKFIMIAFFVHYHLCSFVIYFSCDILLIYELFSHACLILIEHFLF